MTTVAEARVLPEPLSASWAKLRDVAIDEGAHMEDRSYFLALAGLGMNATFALLILTSLIPRYFLSPCE